MLVGVRLPLLQPTGSPLRRCQRISRRFHQQPVRRDLRLVLLSLRQGTLHRTQLRRRHLQLRRALRGTLRPTASRVRSSPLQQPRQHSSRKSAAKAQSRCRGAAGVALSTCPAMLDRQPGRSHGAPHRWRDQRSPTTAGSSPSSSPSDALGAPFPPSSTTLTRTLRLDTLTDGCATCAERRGRGRTADRAPPDRCLRQLPAPPGGGTAPFARFPVREHRWPLP